MKPCWHKFTSHILTTLAIFCAVLIFSSTAYAVTKDEAINKYKAVFARANEMTAYGFDLQAIIQKLKNISDVLRSTQYDKADMLLDEIRVELSEIEAKGPEYLKRSKELAWLEIYGDIVQQLAIFIMMALILLRFDFAKQAIQNKSIEWSAAIKLIVFFMLAGLIGTSIGLIRYGKSAWAFVDLQLLFITLSALLGGLGVGVTTGMASTLFRMAYTSTLLETILPFVIGTAAGLCAHIIPRRPLRHFEVIIAGFMVGVIHSLFVYLPLITYLPWWSFLFTVLVISVVEACIVLSFFMIIQYILREEKRKETEQELIRTRLQFLQAQINPHFLFNTLNTIAAVCGEENAAKARNLVIQLSAFFRRLTKRESDMVTLQEEFDYIDNYLNIEKSRFGERLLIDKEIKLTPEALNRKVPVLVLQPLVENAVKHGISKKTAGGKVKVRAFEENDNIIIEIEDTGVGMNADVQSRLESKLAGRNAQEESNGAGIGVKNIRERMEKRYGNKFQMSLTSGIEKGTTVRVQLPKGD